MPRVMTSVCNRIDRIREFASIFHHRGLIRLDPMRPEVKRPFKAGIVGSGPMQSVVRKRSVLIDRHKTSVSLEDPFWSALQEIARQRNVGMSHLLEEIDRQRAPGNLSSALRVFVLQHYQALGRRGLQTATEGQPLVRPLSNGTAAPLALGE